MSKGISKRKYTIGIIGFGVVGIPLTYQLCKKYPLSFYLITDNHHKKKLVERDIVINGDRINPFIIGPESSVVPLSAIIICVKNYDLISAIETIQPLVDDDTILFPLENGIYAHKTLFSFFPNNRVLQGFIQGPNTALDGERFVYLNPGTVHVGLEPNEIKVCKLIEYLRSAGIEVAIENDINKAVWKKWMLNIAGNSVTALVGADYEDFKYTNELGLVCRRIMEEFREVAKLEGINITSKDIEDTIRYFIEYKGSKKTSTLVDINNKRRTENDYLAGELVRIAKERGIDIPLTEMIYMLLKIKENIVYK